MNKHLWNSDRGITLVELLASLAILSVVILLAGSVHIFGQRQFKSQTESASQANDMSYAMSVVSRELRQEAYDDIEISYEGRNITIKTDNVVLFEKVNDELKKNGNTILSSISDMSVTPDDEKMSLKIIMKSSSSHSRQQTYETTIYFRR